MNRPLKIAIVLGSLDTGGAERVMIRLANGFVTKGISCSLVVLNDKGVLRGEVHPEVDIVTLNSSRARYAVPAFGRFLRRMNPDVLIVAQTHVQLMALLAVKMEKWEGIFLLNEHSLFSHNNRSRVNKYLAKKLFNRVNAVTAVSGPVADDFKKNFQLQVPVEVIPNAAFDPSILQLKNEHIDFVGKVPFVLSVGRLTAGKNNELLIDAFEMVLNERHSRLIIVGDGEHREKLFHYANAKNISGNILFTGNVTNPYAYMERCDVFVLTSSYEGLPTVLIEALACCASIVCVDSPGGAREIISDETLGVLVKPDAHELSRAIINSMGDKKFCEKKLRRAESFNTENAVTAFLTLIRRLK